LGAGTLSLNRKTRCAIIGLGNIASNIDDDPLRTIIWSHAKAYTIHPRFEIVAVSDTSELRLSEFQAKWGRGSINTYTDIRKLMTEERVDVVSICTPSNTHFEIIKILSDYKLKAIFCEKPFVENVNEGELAVRLCASSSIALAVNYMRRWDSLYIHAKRLLESNSIGRLDSIVAYAPTALMTSGSHIIDMMCFLAGDPAWVFGELQEDFVREVHGVSDPGGIAFIKFKNGATGFLKSTSATPRHYMFEIDLLGKEGRIRISDDGREIDVWRFCDVPTSTGAGFLSLVKDEGSSSKYKNERMLHALDNILDAIDTGAKLASDGESALLSLRLIDAIKRSNELGGVKVFV
jgi:predicted dehydrogenase